MIYTPVPTIFCLHACIRPSALAAAGGAQACPSHTPAWRGLPSKLRDGLRFTTVGTGIYIYLLEKIPIFASKGSKGESYGLFTL